jgi:hypothetical protein
MFKIFKSIVGLAIVGATVGLAATPAKAESKTAQCVRLGQAVSTFGKQLPHMQPGQSRSSNIARYLNASEAGLKKMQAQKFSDPKIRRFQQSVLNIFVQAHNDMISLVEAGERRDRPAFINASNRIDQDLAALNPLGNQVEAYCGRSK